MTTTVTMEEWARRIHAHGGMTIAQMVEAGKHGADSDWPGFTYTTNAAEFTETYRAEVWDMLRQAAEEFGCPNVCAFIAGFKRSDMIETLDTFDNLLARYVLEEVGRWLGDNKRKAAALAVEFDDDDRE